MTRKKRVVFLRINFVTYTTIDSQFYINKDNINNNNKITKLLNI